jgi:hypothetical protein
MESTWKRLGLRTLTRRWYPKRGAVSQDTSLDDLLEDPYGWPELQIGIIREALSVAEALPGT